MLDLQQKRYGERKRPSAKPTRSDPNNLRGLLGIAEIYFQESQPEKAIQVIAAEVQKRPERTALRKELANAEFRAKQYDKAIADYQAILDQYKDKPLDQADIYKSLGITYSVMGNPEKAVEDMQKAVELAPANVSYISTLAQYHDNAGKHEEAMAAYRDALKIDPNNGVVLNNLAYDITQYGGDLDEALAFAQHARQEQPKMSEILDTIGWIYFKKDLNASAVEIFRELVDKITDNATFHHHYAMALAQKGDRTTALLELNTALTCHPSPKEEEEIKALIQKFH